MKNTPPRKAKKDAIPAWFDMYNAPAIRKNRIALQMHAMGGFFAMNLNITSTLGLKAIKNDSLDGIKSYV